MLDPYLVVSNQQAPHPNTESCAEKHANTIYCRPFSESQLAAFKLADDWIKKRKKPLILDSGCGTGDSTMYLAQKFPDHSIIGIDRSEHRLERARNKFQHKGVGNFLFVRARLEDFWRLTQLAQWSIERHFIFYPNPWPKSEHHNQRWHGHPVFPDLLRLSDHLELRSNWLLYLQEFSIATHALIGVSETPQVIENPEGISAFERKYKDHQNLCYSLRYDNLSKHLKRKAC